MRGRRLGLVVDREEVPEARQSSGSEGCRFRSIEWLTCLVHCKSMFAAGGKGPLKRLVSRQIDWLDPSTETLVLTLVVSPAAISQSSIRTKACTALQP